MKKHVSHFFIPIYEDYFSKLNVKNPVKESRKIADAVFHEEGFIEWLRIKYKNKLTSITYPKLTNVKNFDLYIKAYKGVKNQKEEQGKRILIYNRIRLEKLKPVSKYEYDVDIVDAYLKIEQLIDSVKIRNDFDRNHYLDAMKQSVIFYCQQSDLPVTQILQMKHPIIVNSDSIGFEGHLGRTLISFDENKIEAILGFQNSIWKGEGLFASFVEHGVYKYVKNNSPFDNNVRLAKIMNWVEKNRVFLPPRDKSKKNVEKMSTLNYGTEKIHVNEFHYWPYSKDSLEELYSELISHNKINKNDSFYELFKKHVNFPENPIVWKASQTQLMYLLYLLYNQKKQWKSEPLHYVVVKLFKKPKSNFNKKVSNTIFNQLIKEIETGKSLSNDLRSIKLIFDKLNLS